jgi:hypothetical protein
LIAEPKYLRSRMPRTHRLSDIGETISSVPYLATTPAIRPDTLLIWGRLSFNFALYRLRPPVRCDRAFGGGESCSWVMTLDPPVRCEPAFGDVAV